MREYPENRLYRFLSNPLTLGGGILLLGLSPVRTPNLFFCAAPGFVLCFCYILLALHRRPYVGWEPRKISLRSLADCSSVVVSPEMLLTGSTRIGRVASPIALSKTLSIRSQSSSFLLATASALTCPCITDPATSAAIHRSLTALGVDPEKMQRQWRLVSYDAPEGVSGVTVQDGGGLRCFFLGDPTALILSCGQLLTGNPRPMTAQDRAELLRTLEDMQLAGGTAIAYAMLDKPDAPVESAVFLGILSLEPELYDCAQRELETLAATGLNVFADLPAGLLAEPLRYHIHPSAHCADKPVCIALRQRRSACMAPVAESTDDWGASLPAWQQWCRELISRSRFHLMALLPAVIWLLIAVIRPGSHTMMLGLLPSLLLLWLNRDRSTPHVSVRWLMLWPAITLLLSAFCGIPFTSVSVGSFFLPGLFVSAAAGQIMLLLPTYLAFDGQKRKMLIASLAAGTFIACILLMFMLAAIPALPFALLLGSAWGIGTMIFLGRRVEQRF